MFYTPARLYTTTFGRAKQKAIVDQHRQKKTHDKVSINFCTLRMICHRRRTNNHWSAPCLCIWNYPLVIRGCDCATCHVVREAPYDHRLGKDKPRKCFEEDVSEGELPRVAVVVAAVLQMDGGAVEVAEEAQMRRMPQNQSCLHVPHTLCCWIPSVSVNFTSRNQYP